MSETGPLPAQPYILVLWATHIGRYAIKHSPSGARERAIVKVLGTLCEYSPSSSFSLSFSWSLLLALPVSLADLPVSVRWSPCLSRWLSLSFSLDLPVSLSESSYFSCTYWCSLAPSLTLFPDAAPPCQQPATTPAAPQLSHPTGTLDVLVSLKSPPSPPVALSSTRPHSLWRTELRNRPCSRVS